MPHRFPSFGLALTTLAVLAAATQAQDRIAAEIYGHGVHSYYRGDLQAANEQFDQAINAGFNDPRVYYFRAISKLRACDTYGAESDIRLGANLEVNGSGAYNVGRALERVQGNLRVRFETLRRQARMEAQMARANQPQPSLPPIMAPSDRSLQEIPPAPTKPLAPTMEPGADNPFADDNGAEILEAPPTETPATDAGAENADPFSDDAEGDDLFGDETPMDAAPPADDTDPFGADADPFGDAAPPAAEDDPFGDAAPPAAEDDPFGDAAPPAVEDDPFAAPAAAGDSAPLPEVQNEDDLFGETGSAKAPFGGNSLNKSSRISDELDSLFSE